MIWINAERNVAFVKNAEARRNWPVVHNPRNNVNAHCLAVKMHIPVNTFPLATHTPSPEPASFGFIYSVPEFFSEIPSPDAGQRAIIQFSPVMVIAKAASSVSASLAAVNYANRRTTHATFLSCQ